MLKKQVMRAWEECVISQEKGNRTVHYIIRDSTGNSLIAVVGSERSVRHMIYTVTKDFIRVFGPTNGVHAGKRWRTRREVVEWLISVVSKHGPILADSNQKIIDTAPSLELEHFMSMMIRFSKRQSPNEENQGSSEDIVWSGDAWTCNKQLKHYPAFCRSGTNIPVYSFVWIMDEEEDDHLGYVEDMYEDHEGEKIVNVRCFCSPEEIDLLIPNLKPDFREVFITSIELEVNAEFIDGLAAVLTPSHFEKGLDLLPPSLLFGCYMCHREFKNNKVKTFSLSKLPGYSSQLIFSSLECDASRQSTNSENSIPEVRGSAPEEPEMPDSNRIKSCSADQTNGNGRGGQTTSFLEYQLAKCETSHQGLKVELLRKRAVDNNVVLSDPPGQTPFQVNKNIEFLCQDSGMRGCWFRCTILHASKKRLRIQYHDVNEVDGAGKLEEWVPASRVADPDKLGVRCAGRLTVRPWPTENSSDLKLDVGAAIDAWWCDGWWEGIIIGCDTSALTNLQVFFPAENRFITIKRNNIRVSKDWTENRWVDVRAKANILSFLTSRLNPEPNLPPLPLLPQPNSSAEENNKVSDTEKLERSEADNRQLLSSSTSLNLEVLGKLPIKKRLAIIFNQEKARTSSDIAGRDGAMGKT